MLTGSEVLAMISAGFTADEIRAYQEDKDTTLPEQPEEPAAAPPDPEEPAEDPEPEAPSFVSREEFAELKTAMESLTKSIHANNVLLAAKENAPKSVSVEEAAAEAIKHFAGIK